MRVWAAMTVFAIVLVLLNFSTATQANSTSTCVHKTEGCKELQKCGRIIGFKPSLRKMFPTKREVRQGCKKWKRDKFEECRDEVLPRCDKLWFIRHFMAEAELIDYFCKQEAVLTNVSVSSDCAPDIFNPLVHRNSSCPSAQQLHEWQFSRENGACEKLRSHRNCLADYFTKKCNQDIGDLVKESRAIAHRHIYEEQRCNRPYIAILNGCWFHLQLTRRNHIFPVVREIRFSCENRVRRHNKPYMEYCFENTNIKYSERPFSKAIQTFLDVLCLHGVEDDDTWMPALLGYSHYVSPVRLLETKNCSLQQELEATDDGYEKCRLLGQERECIRNMVFDAITEPPEASQVYILDHLKYIHQTILHWDLPCSKNMVCKEDEFRCYNGSCVPVAKLADGSNDCGEWEDENLFACPAHNTIRYRNLSIDNQDASYLVCCFVPDSVMKSGACRTD